MLGTSELGHILIVDDDTNITELLRVNLSSMRYSVEVIDRASDVDRGVQGHTRLVIVDAMQQQYSGMDLLKMTRGRSRLPLSFIRLSEVKVW